MKKIYFLTGALLAGIAVNAQMMPTNGVSSKNDRNEIRPTSKKVGNQLKAEGDEWWSNQFETPAEWAQTTGAGHTAGDWAIVNAIPASIQSQQAAYQWPATFSNATANFAFIDSDAAGGSASQDAYFEYQADIDLSGAGNAAMYLTFAEYYRHFYDQNYVEISNDGGATWTTFTVNPESEVPVNTNCIDGEVEVVNITPAIGAGNWSSQVRIRFHYVGQWDWFWGIDDVKIVEAWDNDIKMNTWYQATPLATTQALDYYHIPASQTSFPGLTFGSIVTNNGGMDQASVQLNATATGGYDETGTALAITSASSDSVSVEVPYMPTGIGTKTVNLTTVIGATDADLTNNVASFDMFLTQYEYSRDNNIQSGSISQVSSQEDLPLEIGNMMEIFDDIEVSGVKIRLATQAAGAVGSEYFAKIYLYDSGLGDWVYSAETELGVVASTSATWVTLPVVGGSMLYSAGDVILVVAAHMGGTDEVRFGLANNTVEGTVLGYVADGSGFYLSSPSSVMIRLYDGPASLNELENTFGMNVYPNPSNANTTVSFELNNEAEVSVFVTDLAGKVVYNSELGTVSGSQKLNIDTQSLTNGVYMVNLSVNGSVSTEKLVVRK